MQYTIRKVEITDILEFLDGTLNSLKFQVVKFQVVNPLNFKTDKKILCFLFITKPLILL